MFSDSRDWESVDDFEQWNLSQVKALAKYRKGQGKFDYEFYEQTYYDLKRLSFFINGGCKVLEASDNDRWWRNKMDDYRRRVYGQDRISPYTKTNYQQMLDFSVWSNGLEYFLRVYNKLNSRLVDILNLKVDSVTVSSRTKPFGAKVLLKYAICSRLKKSDKQRLKDALKNMEKLRKTYPFKLKHFPTFTGWLGLEESSSMGGGAVQGHAGKKEDLEEMYSSAAIMGSGSGRIPAERSPEAHKRYVRIRFKRQGLQNFKPNRYFKENK